MGIRISAERVNLTDLVGKNVALKYDGEATGVETPFGTQDVAIARVVDLDAGTQAQSLVFQRAIARQVRESAGDWVVGQLTEHPNDKYEDGSIYQLDAPSLSMSQIEAAFAKANTSF